MMYVFVLIALVCMSCCNAGEIYKVGDSSGWTSINLAPNFYKSWTTSKVFHVGDTILFEYNKEFHSVVRVTHKNFNACNSTHPYAKWATGNDSFTIRKPGHYYFICDAPGHCSSGQKVNIRVLDHHKQSHAPLHAPSPSPLGPVHVPSPSSPPPSPVHVPSPLSSPPSPVHVQSPSPSPSDEAPISSPPTMSVAPAQAPKKSAAYSMNSYMNHWFVVAICLAMIAF